jgi:hypothetical protein
VFGTKDLDSLIGSTIRDDGFVSTTTRQNVAIGGSGVGAASGANRALVKIHAPEGTKGVWVQGLSDTVSSTERGVKSSMASTEGEFILPHGTKFRVISVKRGILPEIEVEIIP